MEKLKGKIEKIIYRNEVNGFTVATFSRDEFTLDTITGSFHKLNEGDELNIKGVWKEHPKYGKQFVAEEYEEILPEDLNDIEKYLASGLIPGIGPAIAKKIVDKFKDKTFDMLDNNIKLLEDIPGLNENKVLKISEEWEKQKNGREIMVFLKGLGISTIMATKIIKAYGVFTTSKIKTNPYSLIKDVYGIGFKLSDKIAYELGFAEDNPLRIKALIINALEDLADSGHVFYPIEDFKKLVSADYNTTIEIVADIIKELQEDGDIILDKPNTKELIYLKSLYMAEVGSYNEIVRLTGLINNNHNTISVEKIESLLKDAGIILSDEQKNAVINSLHQKAMIITGGPGTGKTTIQKSILKIYSFLDKKILLTAPTGRAAKRIKESSGYEASTIHRLLEYNPRDNQFYKNEENPLEADLIIVDEVSMVDINLFYSLLNAIPSTAVLILVGDVDQLPSVGPGNVLKDLIESQKLKVYRLTKIFRQAEKSKIILNSHKINNGEMPELNDSQSDFVFEEYNRAEDILNRIVELVSEELPHKHNMDPLQDVQILSPMYKGEVGVNNINIHIQNSLNPAGTEILNRKLYNLRVSDKVMQLKNNYDKDVFNGDIGKILEYQKSGQKTAIVFDDKIVYYEYEDLEEIVPAYACTVHKAQGSEYPVIIMPIVNQQYIMLQRKLLYTAVTRGKKLVYLLGNISALNIAVKNNKSSIRYSALGFRLKNNYVKELSE